MKNLFKIAGIIAMIAVIGFAVIACESPVGPEGPEGPAGKNGKDGVDGKDGIDGNTGTLNSVLTIGENGNWFIDGDDTHVKATGPTGPAGAATIGSILSIGANGNWFINNADTHVAASGGIVGGGGLVVYYGNGGYPDTYVTSIGSPAPTLTPKTGYYKLGGWYDYTLTTLIDVEQLEETASVYAKWVPKYNVGDTGPGGGKIFHAVENGFTVLMRSTGGYVSNDNWYVSGGDNPDPSNISSSDSKNYIAYFLEVGESQGKLAWGASTSNYENDVAALPSNMPGSGSGTIDKPALIGAGRLNTSYLTNLSVFYAAYYCKEYRGGGKDDWFLPSILEASLLYLYSSTYNNVLSSTQRGNNSNTVWASSTGNFASIQSDSTTATVYPIRAF